MPWKRMLAYITGSVNEDLLRRIEYLLEENRVRFALRRRRGAHRANRRYRFGASGSGRQLAELGFRVIRGGGGSDGGSAGVRAVETVVSHRR